MRLSSPELSDHTPTSPPPRRRKHCRHVAPSPSISTTSPPLTLSQDEESFDEIDPSPPPSHSISASPPYNDDDSLTSPFPAPAYINVAPLPVFRGAPGECPVTHLSRFARVCRANNAATADAILRVFPVTLDAEAALWYELSVEPYPSMTWEEIKGAFLQAYRPPGFADESRAELMGIRQGDDEGVNSYHLRFRWILKKWPEHGIPDAVLKGIFVDGLCEEFQDWVAPQKPETLGEAVRMAMAWEQARSARSARRRREAAAVAARDDVGVAKCGFCDGPHEEGVCEVRRRMRELWIRSKEGVAAPATAAAGRDEGDDGREVGRAMSLRVRGGQCQCWKHQCWKKYERSSSAVTTQDVNAVASPNAEYVKTEV